MKANEQKKVEVTLLKQHTHAGDEYAVGDKISVTEPERDWLATQYIIAKPLGRASDPRTQS